MFRRRHVVAAAIAASAALSGCDEPLTDLTGPTPNLQPTFASIQRDIFQSTDQAGRAACVSCHAGSNPFTALNLTGAGAYDAIVNAPSRQKAGVVLVVPGDPENSYVVHKLEGRQGIVGERMPRTQGPFLTPGQMLVIKRWIEIGAPNN